MLYLMLMKVNNFKLYYHILTTLSLSLSLSLSLPLSLSSLSLPPAVEATLRGEPSPRIDSMETPSVPHKNLSHSNGGMLSNRPHMKRDNGVPEIPSRSNRALPPPPINRVVSNDEPRPPPPRHARKMSETTPTTNPAVPPRPKASSIPSNNSAPPIPMRPITSSSPSRPTPTTTTISPNRNGPPPPSRPVTAPKPGRGPKPTVPKKNPALTRIPSIRIEDMSLADKIAKVQKDAPVLVDSINNQGPNLARELDDFAQLVTSIVENSQNSSNDASVQFKRCVAVIQSQKGALVDPSLLNDTIKLTKIVDILSTKVQLLSTHLKQ